MRKVYTGNIVDLEKQVIITGRLVINNGLIEEITEDKSVKESSYIIPGFVDSHIHIESSMLIPSEFEKIGVFSELDFREALDN